MRYFKKKCFLLQVNLNDGMDKILKSLDKYPVKTRLSLTGTLIVARDIAHAKLKERLNSEGSLPQYFKDHPVYYAGPAKTPEVCCQRYHLICEFLIYKLSICSILYVCGVAVLCSTLVTCKRSWIGFSCLIRLYKYIVKAIK